MTARIFFCSGALLAGLSVVLGAYAAHDGSLTGEQVIWLEKATRYQMYHALALILTALTMRTSNGGGLARAAGWCFIGGIALFSGSLYLMTFTPLSMGLITPTGGTLMIIGWLLLGLGSFGKH